MRHVIVCGNDATGKTSLVKYLNNLIKPEEFCFYERSSINSDQYVSKEQTCFIDQLTLQFPNICFNLPSLPKLSDDNHQLFYIVLDCDDQLSDQRINQRLKRDIYEMPRNLFYFSKKYIQIARLYGLPIISTNNSSPGWESIVGQKILQLFENDNQVFNSIQQLALKSMDREKVMKLENEGLLENIHEGESKIIYKIHHSWFHDIIISMLKPTIYSHSQQATAEIDNLEKIRAVGNIFILEILHREWIQHTYQCINENGVVMSLFLETVPPVEVVVKAYDTGTDKYSYHELPHLSDYRLPGGPYIRFDWRNPNHIHPISRLSPIQMFGEKEYFAKERTMSKPAFLQYLKDQGFVPFGDKCVSTDLLKNLSVINVERSQFMAMKMFLAIKYYLSLLNLEIMDVCFMFDQQGKIGWSEISLDCMRVKEKSQKRKSIYSIEESMDKDIWRAGGSGNIELLIKKWTLFNKMMFDFWKDATIETTLLKNYAYSGASKMAFELLDDQSLTICPDYRNLLDEITRSNNPKSSRRFLLTLDIYDQQPVLVQKGKVIETHSEGNVQKAMSFSSIHPDVLVVDLWASINNGDRSKNSGIIKQIAHNYFVHTGGGLRHLKDVQEMLESSVRRVVVSTNTDRKFLEPIDKSRLIVELSINEHNQIMVAGRSVIDLAYTFEERVLELSKIGVEAISITFHNTEGGLNGIPREQFVQIIPKIPHSIKKIFVAGGISSFDDLYFLWSFPRVIPQFGSLVWKSVLTLGQIYSKMMKFDKDGKLPITVQDQFGHLKGVLKISPRELIELIDSRKLSINDETSNVIQISSDCSNQILLVNIDRHQKFCKINNNDSCFTLQTANSKNNLSILFDHLIQKQKQQSSTKSYGSVQQSNPGIAFCRLWQELWELACAEGFSQVHEGADILIHFLFYLRGKGIDLSEILNQLNARRHAPSPPLIQKQLSSYKTHFNNPNIFILAVTESKYTDFTDQFCEKTLGFSINRAPASSRDVKLSFEIKNNVVFQSFFGQKTLQLLGVKPKDMPFLIASQMIHGCIAWNSVMKNYPPVAKRLVYQFDPNLKIALISRDNDSIDEQLWSPTQKCLIACEHPITVTKFLRDSMGIDESRFSIDRVLGSSESFLVNSPPEQYRLGDAVVSSGTTLKDNKLTIWKVVKDGLKIGFYSSLLLFETNQ